ncbi:MAG: PadR family transcriptional regulator [Candidatus Brocadiia bacterium]
MEFRSDLVKGSVAPIVLKLLSERERYGYEIVKLVNERTQGALQWKEGTLYPCLHQLESDGLLSSAWREAESGKQRKYYRITRKGRAELASRTEEWAAFSKTITALLMGATA